MSIDLQKLETKLDVALSDETSESLSNWLKNKRTMKITISKIKRELEKKGHSTQWLDESSPTLLIKDVRTIIDEQLKSKGISIK